MSKPPDTNDLVENDAQKVQDGIRKYRQNNGFGFNPAKIVEATMWAVAIGAAIAMVVALPWVGVDKPISGTAWIGVGSTLIIVGIVGGMVVRFASQSFQDADRAMSEKFERGR